MSAQAREAEDEYRAAQSAERAKLEEAVARAGASAEETRKYLRRRADEAEVKVSSWWRDLQQQRERQVQEVRPKVEAKRDQHDAKMAAIDADMVEADAEFAVAMANAAIEEAEYASLQAALARGRANEFAAAR